MHLMDAVDYILAAAYAVFLLTVAAMFLGIGPGAC